MNIKKALLTSAVAVSLIGMGGVSIMPAAAQKAGILSPATNWAVTQTQGQAGQYCTLARSFERNVVLTIAKNQAAQSTLAIDLQRAFFKPGHVVKVALDPGAGEQRVYDITPVSNRVIIAGIGDDPAFFSALQKTGFLRVQFGAQSYHFNLSDIDAGQAKLESCLTRSASKPQMAAVPSVSVPDDRAVNSLKGKINDLTQNNQALLRRIQTLESEKEQQALVPLPVPASAPVVDDTQIQALSSQIERLQGDNSSLEQSLVAMRAQLEGAQSGSHDLEALRADNAKLARSLAAAQLKIQEVASAPAPAPVVDRSEVDALSAQIRQLESEKASLEQSLSSMDARLAAAQADKSGNSEVLAQLEARNSELSHNLAAVQAQLSAAQGVQSGQSGELAALQETNRQLSDSNQQLMDQLAAAQQEIAAIPVADPVEVGALAEQIKTLQSENFALEEDLASLQAQLQSEQGAKVDGLLALEESHAQLEASLEAAQAQLKQAQAENVDNVLVLEENNRQLEAEKQRLNEKLAALQVQVDGAGQEQFAVIAELQGEVEALSRENSNLSAQLAEFQNAQRASEQVALFGKNENDAQDVAPEPVDLLPVEAIEPSAGDMLIDASPDVELLAASNGSGLVIDMNPLQASLPQEPVVELRPQVVAAAPPVDLLNKQDIDADDLNGLNIHQVLALAAQRSAASVAEEELSEEPALVLASAPVAEEAVAEDADILMPEPIDLVEEMPVEEPALIARASDEVFKSNRSVDRAGVTRRVILAEDSEINGRFKPVVERDSLDKTLDVASASLPAPAAVERESAAEVVEEKAALVEENVPLSVPPFARASSADTTAVQELEALPAPKIEKPLVVSKSELVAPAIYKADVDVSHLLSSANVASKGSVQLVAGAASADKAVYRWRARDIYGTAEQSALSNVAQFDDLVLEYLERTQARCPGEFAAIPDQSHDVNGQRVDSYDVACVADNVSSSAALLFFNDGGTFTVIAQEVPTEMLSAALESREILMNSITGRDRLASLK